MERSAASSASGDSLSPLTPPQAGSPPSSSVQSPPKTPAFTPGSRQALSSSLSFPLADSGATKTPRLASAESLGSQGHAQLLGRGSLNASASGEAPHGGSVPAGSDSASVMTAATNTAEATLEEHILARIGLIVQPPANGPAVR